MALDLGTKENMERCNSSMQLTRGADYAIRVMIHLARIADEGRVSLPMLGEATGAPDSFLSKVLQSLTKAQLVASQRGPAGGFQISDRGRHASMRDVIEAIDGPLSLNVCLSDHRSCFRKGWCPAHPVWVKAQAALLEVLTSSRIADLAVEADRRLPIFVDQRTGTD